MKIILISAVLLQVSCCYAYPAQGVSSFAYQDSAGNRAKNGGGQQLPFRSLLQSSRRIFGSDFEGQRLASYAARKAYDLTYNHIGYTPNFFRFSPFSAGFPFFGQGGFPGMAGNQQSAFASAVGGPGFIQQVAAIDPINVGTPNVDVTNRFNDEISNGNPNKVYSVSSSAFATSSNLDGKVTGFRGAETVVNDNGKITKYKVHS